VGKRGGKLRPKEHIKQARAETEKSRRKPREKKLYHHTTFQTGGDYLIQGEAYLTEKGYVTRKKRGLKMSGRGRSRPIDNRPIREDL